MPYTEEKKIDRLDEALQRMDTAAERIRAAMAATDPAKRLFSIYSAMDAMASAIGWLGGVASSQHYVGWTPESTKAP